MYNVWQSACAGLHVLVEVICYFSQPSVFQVFSTKHKMSATSDYRTHCSDQNRYVYAKVKSGETLRTYWLGTVTPRVKSRLQSWSTALYFRHDWERHRNLLTKKDIWKSPRLLFFKRSTLLSATGSIYLKKRYCLGRPHLSDICRNKYLQHSVLYFSKHSASIKLSKNFYNSSATSLIAKYHRKS